MSFEQTPSNGKQEQFAERMTLVPFQQVPEGINSGTDYITPTALVECGVTKYTLTHVLRLVKTGIVPATHMAGMYLFLPGDVQKLLEYEDGNPQRIHQVGGRRPGPLKRPDAYKQP